MLIATLPPYVRHAMAICQHPYVDALRFNTVMPLADSKHDVLKKLLDMCQGKPLWIDLKARQLRITQFAYVPYAYVRISRKIKVSVPTEVLFKNTKATLVEVVDGDKLILETRPSTPVGEGQPLNILDPSLKIEGYLTDSDLEYVEAANSLGIHTFMLSFVETLEDIYALHSLDPEALVVAKIESNRGLDFVANTYSAVQSFTRLMAATDDLYINLGKKKVGIIPALKTIIEADPLAIAASHILTSLESGEEPSMTDITLLPYLTGLGYQVFMFSDGVCFSSRSFYNAIDTYAQYADLSGMSS